MADHPSAEGNPAGDGGSAPATPRLRERWGRRPVLWIGAFLFLLGGSGAGLILWPYYAYRVSTDDAFIEGHVAPVSAKIPGTVQEVLVDDNQQVTEGQVLGRIDPRDYQVKLEQAKAAVGMARANLEAATWNIPFSRETTQGAIAQAKAALESGATAVRASQDYVQHARAAVAAREAALAAARADLEAILAQERKARLDLARMSRLVKEGAVAQQDFDTAKAASDVVAAQVDAARRRVAQAERDLDMTRAELKLRETGYDPVLAGVEAARAKVADAEAQLMQAEARRHGLKIREAERQLATARLQEARANLDLARLQLEYTVIRAPLAGRITKKSVEVGQVVQPGQPLLAVVLLGDVWVVANYKETQLRGVRPGQPVTMRVDAYPGRTFRGHVDSIQAGTGARFSLLPPENATGNYVKVVQRVPVKIVLEKGSDPDHLLRPGMSVVPTIEIR